MQPYNITVTDVDPGAAPHFEVMVAGTAGAEHPARRPGILGIADYACQIAGPLLRVVLPERARVRLRERCLLRWRRDRDLRHGRAEIAHAWTLDHATPSSDPMTYNPYTNPLTFNERRHVRQRLRQLQRLGSARVRPHVHDNDAPVHVDRPVDARTRTDDQDAVRPGRRGGADGEVQDPGERLGAAAGLHDRGRLHVERRRPGGRSHRSTASRCRR